MGQILLFPPGPPPPTPPGIGVIGASAQAQGGTLSVFGLPGTGPGDVLIEIFDLQRYNEFSLQSRLGTMEVLASLDGDTFSPPLALEEKTKPNWDGYELETEANRQYYFKGNFKAVRIVQAGAANVADSILVAGKIGRAQD
jgi:hypothetical protein